MDYSFDTICATATPLSLGSIGVIRISGEDAFRIVEKIFSKKITPKMIKERQRIIRCLITVYDT